MSKGSRPRYCTCWWVRVRGLGGAVGTSRSTVTFWLVLVLHWMWSKALGCTVLELQSWIQRHMEVTKGSGKQQTEIVLCAFTLWGWVGGGGGGVLKELTVYHMETEEKNAQLLITTKHNQNQKDSRGEAWLRLMKSHHSVWVCFCWALAEFTGSVTIIKTWKRVIKKYYQQRSYLEIDVGASVVQLQQPFIPLEGSGPDEGARGNSTLSR